MGRFLSHLYITPYWLFTGNTSIGFFFSGKNIYNAYLLWVWSLSLSPPLVNLPLEGGGRARGRGSNNLIRRKKQQCDKFTDFGALIKNITLAGLIQNVGNLQ